MENIDTEECEGKWQMLDNPCGSKWINLESNGEARFVGITIEDIGRGEKGKLPESGTWKLSPDDGSIKFCFTFNNGDYSESGLLKRRNNGLELWFSVGDPDDYMWKRFRLLKPQAD